MAGVRGPERAGVGGRQQVDVSELIEALSFALDLTEGACPGHAVRTCVIGMRIGCELQLPADLLHDLYYALLLKDVGCSSNSSRLCQIVGNDEVAAKQLTKTSDWTRTDWSQVTYIVKRAHRGKGFRDRARSVASMMKHRAETAREMILLRCDRGATVVRDLGLSQATAGAIYCLDEHWDGLGYPDGLAGDDIPLLARVANLAQVYEVFQRQFGVDAALEVVRKRSKRWFDPALVKVAVALERTGRLTAGLADSDIWKTLSAYQPAGRRILTDAFAIDSICEAFAGVVDAKSPYTYRHSSGVARAAQEIGKCLNLPSRDLVTLRRAGLLHDLGKLGVSNRILDKPGKLTTAEWDSMRRHTQYTFDILHRITGFEGIAWVAASHHEKLDGSGYHLGLKAADLPLVSRVLTVADMFDALSSDRPYRQPLERDEILKMLWEQAPHAIDRDCVAAVGSFPQGFAAASDGW